MFISSTTSETSISSTATSEASISSSVTLQCPLLNLYQQHNLRSLHFLNCNLRSLHFIICNLINVHCQTFTSSTTSKASISPATVIPTSSSSQVPHQTHLSSIIIKYQEESDPSVITKYHYQVSLPSIKKNQTHLSSIVIKYQKESDPSVIIKYHYQVSQRLRLIYPVSLSSITKNQIQVLLSSIKRIRRRI